MGISAIYDGYLFSRGNAKTIEELFAPREFNQYTDHNSICYAYEHVASKLDRDVLLTTSFYDNTI